MKLGIQTSATTAPPRARCAAAFWKQATCSSWVSRLVMTLKTMYTRLNSPCHAGGSDVTNGEADAFGAGLCSQTGEHRLGDVDTRDPDSALAQRDGHAASADAEFERRTASGYTGEEVDRRAKHVRVEHGGRIGVIAGGNGFVEGDFGHSRHYRVRTGRAATGPCRESRLDRGLPLTADPPRRTGGWRRLRTPRSGARGGCRRTARAGGRSNP